MIFSGTSASESLDVYNMNVSTGKVRYSTLRYTVYAMVHEFWCLITALKTATRFQTLCLDGSITQKSATALSIYGGEDLCN
jgi:hypothetical protein